AANAETAIDTIDTAIDDITNLRATTGAGLSRLEQVVGSLETTSSNLSSARGRIMDADFAKETANLTRAQILQQAGTAMLAQANQLPNNVLSLLR
ncbi:flagellin, partial [Limnobacter sp. UBA1615]